MSKEKKLTNKLRVFVEYYVQSWNQTEAARRAGYKGNDVTLASVGYENLRKPQVAELVSKRIAEIAMDSNEVLARLSQHARGNFSPFVTPEGTVDLATEQARANIGLLKKVKVKQRVIHSDDDKEPIIETESEIELHDPQAALVHMGRHHRLFGDNTSLNIDLSQLTDEQVDRIANGEDPIRVLADAGKGRAREAQETDSESDKTNG